MLNVSKSVESLILTHISSPIQHGIYCFLSGKYFYSVLIEFQSPRHEDKTNGHRFSDFSLSGLSNLSLLKRYFNSTSPWLHVSKQILGIDGSLNRETERWISDEGRKHDDINILILM